MAKPILTFASPVIFIKTLFIISDILVGTPGIRTETPKTNVNIAINHKIAIIISLLSMKPKLTKIEDFRKFVFYELLL